MQITSVNCFGNIIWNYVGLRIQSALLEWQQFRFSIVIWREKGLTSIIFTVHLNLRKCFFICLMDRLWWYIIQSIFLFKVYLGIRKHQSDTGDWYFFRPFSVNHIWFWTDRFCYFSFRLAGIIELFMSDFVILFSNWMIHTKIKIKKSLCVNWFSFTFE